MLTPLGRSVLSSALRLSPIYRTPLVYPVGSGHRTPIDYRNPTGTRAYSTSDGDGGDDYEELGPIPPTILYTDGIRGVPEKGSHFGIGIFVDDDHELNVYQPLPWKEQSIFNVANPELQVIRIALMRLYKWPSFLNEDVIIRTHYEPVIDEFEKWRKGDLEGSKSLRDVWRMMDRFPNVRIEQADMEDGCMHMAMGMAILALEEAEEKSAAKVALTKPAPNYLQHSVRYPLSLTIKEEDKKKDE